MIQLFLILARNIHARYIQVTYYSMSTHTHTHTYTLILHIYYMYMCHHLQRVNGADTRVNFVRFHARYVCIEPSRGWKLLTLIPLYRYRNRGSKDDESRARLSGCTACYRIIYMKVVQLEKREKRIYPIHLRVDAAECARATSTCNAQSSPLSTFSKNDFKRCYAALVL